MSQYYERTIALGSKARVRLGKKCAEMIYRGGEKEMEKLKAEDSSKQRTARLPLW